MPILENIKIYGGNLCIDENNLFPEYCNIDSSYSNLLLKNTRKYEDIKSYITIDTAFYFIFPLENEYDHWLIEHVSRFVDYKMNMPLLVSEMHPSYVSEFIADFAGSNVYYISPYSNYLVKKLYVPIYYNLNLQYKKLSSTYIYKLIKEKYTLPNKLKPTPKYIYISNTDTSTPISNNLELTQYFKDIGVDVVNIENLSFRQRVQLFLYNSVITICNKNLASSIFSECSVDSILYPNDKYYFFWRILSQQMGFKYMEHNTLISNNNNVLIENFKVAFDEYSQYSFMDNIYIITLQSVYDRVENVKKIIASYPNIKMFNAIDKNDIIRDHTLLDKYLLDKWISHEFMEKYQGLYGKLCCKLSHLSLWQKCYSEGRPYIIVLEDDIKLLPKFNNKIQKILDEVGNNFYFVNLYKHPHYAYSQNKYSKKRLCDKKSVNYMTPQYGNVGYIINYKLCEIIFKNLETYNTMHNDLITEYLCRKYPKKFYITNENIIETLGDVSYNDYKRNSTHKIKSTIWIDFNEEINKDF
jgi:GR25 family glycosyltransferase involved in LPS biosynthesis